jgi:hypothetical protein
MCVLLDGTPLSYSLPIDTSMAQDTCHSEKKATGFLRSWRGGSILFEAMRRVVGLCWILLFGRSIAEAEPAPQPSLPGSSGFRLEGKPAIDDVFGDASDYRHTVDRFLDLTARMQSTRDEFAKAVQVALRELGGQSPAKGSRPSACPMSALAAPYSKAQRLGTEYLRLGRELARHHDQVKEFDHLGETLGLTPDYRWKVRRVLVQFGALLTDYREMKVAFHDQLIDELTYARCDLSALLLRADPEQHGPTEDVAWPAPGAPGAPGVLLAQRDREAAHETPPASSGEKIPTPSPIPFPPPRTNPAEGPSAAVTRSGIFFYVDNTLCQRPSKVVLDGKKIGDVPAGTRVAFQTLPGPHELCLQSDPKRECGSVGTIRKGYLHEGWTIALRCE